MSANAVGYFVGEYFAVHTEATSLPAPSDTDGLDLAATFGPPRPSKLSVLIVPSEGVTVTNLIPWSRVGETWATVIQPGGSTDVTHASVAITTSKALLFTLDLPVHGRLAFQGTLDTGNVTISVAGIFERA